MSDPYQILEVEKTASIDDIKKAYKRLAKQHHPDCGGDVVKFQEISEAYQKLINGGDQTIPYPNIDPAIASMLNNLFSGPFRHSTRIFNQNIRIAVTLAIKDLIFGCEKLVTIRYSNTYKNLKLKFPAGLRPNDTLTFNNFGDDTNKSIPAGNLDVIIQTQMEGAFCVINGHLEATQKISVWQAMLGATIKLETVDNQIISLVIPAGTPHNKQFWINDHGLYNSKSKLREPLIVNIQIELPSLTEEQKEIIQNWA